MLKNPEDSCTAGDIGAAVSSDDGITWQHLGIVLDEPWHLSYPFVFSWQDQVRMQKMPQDLSNQISRLENKYASLVLVRYVGDSTSVRALFVAAC